VLKEGRKEGTHTGNVPPEFTS